MSRWVSVTFTVGIVQGQSRPRFSYRSRHAYKTEDDRGAEKLLRDAYKAASIDRYGCVVKAPFRAPVRLGITTRRPLPPSRPRSRTSEPDVYKPDADNICKLVADALNGVAYVDDAQITSAFVAKLDRRRDTDETETLVTVSWEEKEETWERW